MNALRCFKHEQISQCLSMTKNLLMREWSEEISANFHGCLENSKLGCKEMNPDFVDCWESCFPAQKLEKGSKLF